jgi:hypothetical protein
MDSPQTYLLKKIIGHATNGLDSLGKLNAMHVEDIAEVIRSFAVETITELVERLNKGESIDLGNGKSLTFKSAKKKKQ